MRRGTLRCTAAVTAVAFFAVQVVSPPLPLSAQTLWEDRRAAHPPLKDPLPAPEPSSSHQNEKDGALPPWLARLAGRHGEVDQVLRGAPSAPWVVILQDLHGHAEAQRNLAVLLGLLPEGAVAGLEGATGPFDFAPFRRAAPPGAVLRAAGHLMEKSWIGGPQYAGLTLPAPPRFVGVEEEKSYLANVAALEDARPRLPAMARELAAARARLEEAKAAIFPPELLSLDGRRRAHAEGRLGLGEYVDTLPPAPDLKALSRFRAARALELSLDFAAVERERQSALQRLSARLAGPALERLAADAAGFRAGDLSAAGFHGRLDVLLRAVASAPGPALAAYLDYMRLCESIDRRGLIDELRALEARAAEPHLGAAGRRALWELSDDLNLIDKLTRQDLASFEWRDYLRRKPAIPGRLAALGEREELPAALPAFEAFYAAADARNRAMADRLLAAAGAGPAALVTGGFHTEGVAELLIARGRQVAVVSPRVSTVEGLHSLAAFVRERTPLDRILLGEKLHLVMHPALGARPYGRFMGLYRRVTRYFVALAAAFHLAEELAEGPAAPRGPDLSRILAGARKAAAEAGVPTVRDAVPGKPAKGPLGAWEIPFLITGEDGARVRLTFHVSAGGDLRGTEKALDAGDGLLVEAPPAAWTDRLASVAARLRPAARAAARALRDLISDRRGLAAMAAATPAGPVLLAVAAGGGEGPLPSSGGVSPDIDALAGAPRPPESLSLLTGKSRERPTLSPDGRFAAVARDGGLALHRLDGPAPEQVPLDGADGMDAPIAAVAFSPDGARLAVTLYSGDVMTWNTETGRKIASFMVPHEETPTLLTFLPDGRGLFYAGQGTSYLFPEGTLAGAESFRSVDMEPLAAAWSPDGDLLAVLGEDDRVHLWSRSSGGRPHPPLNRPHRVLALAFVPGTRALLVGEEGGAVTLWDLAAPRAPRLRAAYRTGIKDVWSLAASRDQTAFAVLGDGGRAEVWNIPSEERAARLEPGDLPEEPYAGDAALSDDGSRLSALLHADVEPMLASWSGLSEPRALPGEPLPWPIVDDVHAAAVSPDGSRLALADGPEERPRRLVVGDPSQEDPAAFAPGFGVTRLAFSPDGGRLAAADRSGRVNVWRSEDLPGRRGQRAPAAEADFPTAPLLSGLAFQGGRVVATLHDDGFLRRWDADTGRPLDAERLHASRAKHLAAGPGGALISLGASGLMRESRDGRLRSVEVIQEMDPHRLAVSPDGESFLAASWDGRARLTAPGGRSVDVLLRDPAGRGGVAGALNEAFFLPDGRILAAGGAHPEGYPRPTAFIHRPPLRRGPSPTREGKMARLLRSLGAFTRSRDGEFISSLQAGNERHFIRADAVGGRFTVGVETARDAGKPAHALDLATHPDEVRDLRSFAVREGGELKEHVLTVVLPDDAFSEGEARNLRRTLGGRGVPPGAVRRPTPESPVGLRLVGASAWERERSLPPPAWFPAFPAEGPRVDFPALRRGERAWRTSAFFQPPRPAAALARSPGGEWLAAGLREAAPAVSLFNPRTGERRDLSFGDDRLRTVRALAFSADGAQLFGYADDGRLAGWLLADPDAEPPRLVQVGREPRAPAAFDASGTRFAWGAASGHVLVMRLDEPSWPPTVLGGAGRGPASALAFSADGAALAVARKESVESWLVDDPSAPAKTIPAPGEVSALAFHPQLMLAAGTRDGAVALYDGDPGTGIAPLRLLRDPLQSIASLHFAAGGEALVSLTEAGRARVWDTQDFTTADPAATLPAERPVQAMASWPEGMLVADTKGVKEVPFPLTESWTGRRGGPWMYGLVMPLLEEAARWLPLLWGGDPMPWALAFYPLVHAGLHAFSDVREGGWRLFLRRFPVRAGLSIAFALAGLAGGELSLWLGDGPVGQSLSAFLGGTAAHALFNLLWEKVRDLLFTRSEPLSVNEAMREFRLAERSAAARLPAEGPQGPPGDYGFRQRVLWYLPRLPDDNGALLLAAYAAYEEARGRSRVVRRWPVRRLRRRLASMRADDPRCEPVKHLIHQLEARDSARTIRALFPGNMAVETVMKSFLSRPHPLDPGGPEGPALRRLVRDLDAAHPFLAPPSWEEALRIEPGLGEFFPTEDAPLFNRIFGLTDASVARHELRSMRDALVFIKAWRGQLKLTTAECRMILLTALLQDVSKSDPDIAAVIHQVEAAGTSAARSPLTPAQREVIRSHGARSVEKLEREGLFDEILSRGILGREDVFSLRVLVRYHADLAGFREDEKRAPGRERLRALLSIIHLADAADASRDQSRSHAVGMPPKPVKKLLQEEEEDPFMDPSVVRVFKSLTERDIMEVEDTIHETDPYLELYGWLAEARRAARPGMVMSVLGRRRRPTKEEAPRGLRATISLDLPPAAAAPLDRLFGARRVEVSIDGRLAAAPLRGPRDAYRAGTTLGAKGFPDAVRGWAALRPAGREAAQSLLPYLLLGWLAARGAPPEASPAAPPVIDVTAAMEGPVDPRLAAQWRAEAEAWKGRALFASAAGTSAEVAEALQRLGVPSSPDRVARPAAYARAGRMDAVLLRAAARRMDPLKTDFRLASEDPGRFDRLWEAGWVGMLLWLLDGTAVAVGKDLLRAINAWKATAYQA